MSDDDASSQDVPRPPSEAPRSGMAWGLQPVQGVDGQVTSEWRQMMIERNDDEEKERLRALRAAEGIATPPRRVPVVPPELHNHAIVLGDADTPERLSPCKRQGSSSDNGELPPISADAHISSNTLANAGRDAPRQVTPPSDTEETRVDLQNPNARNDHDSNNDEPPAETARDQNTITSRTRSQLHERILATQRRDRAQPFDTSSEEEEWQKSQLSHRVQRVVYYLLKRRYSIPTILQILHLLLRTSELPSHRQLVQLARLREANRLQPPVCWRCWEDANEVPLAALSIGSSNERLNKALERLKHAQQLRNRRAKESRDGYRRAEGVRDIFAAEWLFERLRAMRHDESVKPAMGIPAGGADRIMTRIALAHKEFGGPATWLLQKSSTTRTNELHKLHAKFSAVLPVVGSKKPEKFSEFALSDSDVALLRERLNEVAPLDMSRRTPPTDNDARADSKNASDTEHGTESPTRSWRSSPLPSDFELADNSAAFSEDGWEDSVDI